MQLMLDIYICGTFHAGSSLTIDDLRMVNKAVYDMRDKWFQFGVELGIQPGTLKSIKRKSLQDPDECLLELLTEWLKTEEPTWKKLVEALKSDTVSEANLAKRIERDHCTKPGNVLCIHKHLLTPKVST